MKNFIAILMAILTIIICACSESREGWTISGNISGAADSTLYIETSNLGNWYVVDSVEVNSEGNFTFRAAEPDSIAGIYRLRLGTNTDYIYFPAQGTEVLELKADSKTFSRGYTLTGTAAAIGFARADSLINTTIDRVGMQKALTDSALRADLNVMINRDTTCIVSYYIINKHLGPNLFYRLDNRRDLAMLGNAANNYKTHRPNDPRAKELEDRFINAKKRNSKASTEINVPEEMRLSRPTVKMAFYDIKGQLQDFDKVVTRGGVTVLNFTRYDGEASPANTVALNALYEKYHSQGLQIYQISYDPDELNWKRNAANMPWISVWVSADEGSAPMLAYNVNPIDAPPTSFIFDRNGNLTDRITNPKELPAKVAALLQ